MASKAPVYTQRRLLGAEGPHNPQAPRASTQLSPMHKPPVASALSTGQGRNGWLLLGERAAAAGSTTARLRVVSKCARGTTPRGGGNFRISAAGRRILSREEEF